MKKNILQIVFFALFLIAFNILFFLLSGTDNPTQVWVAYGFIHWAYLMVLITPLLGTKGKNSFYLNSTLYVQSISYFCIELVMGLVIIIWRPENILWSVLPQSALWLIYMFLIIANAWSNQVTDSQIKKRETEHVAITVNRMELKKLMMQTEDPDTKRRIHEIYELLTASATRQTSASVPYDIQINNHINILQQEIYAKGNNSDEILKELKKLALQRKAELKYTHQ